MFKIKNKKRVLRFLYSFVMFSLVTNMSFLGVFFVANEASAGNDTVLEITCDDVEIDGNIWTFSGTWKAYNPPGLISQYDAAIFVDSSLGDESSIDSPDEFSIEVGPDDYVSGNGNKEDGEGTWQNEYDFSSGLPSSVSALLYHVKVPGNESSGEAFCSFTLSQLNTYYKDSDGDGYGDSNNPIQALSLPDEYVENNTDCNDDNFSIHPDAEEICNGLDDNCNNEVDEGVTTIYYLDSDYDGYGDPDTYQEACSAPDDYIEDNTDCNDNDASIHPGANEKMGDGIDQDCNGFDLTSLCGNNIINSGEQCDNSTFPEGYSSDNFTCSDSCMIEPIAPSCNLSEDDYDYIFDFGNVILVTNGAGENPSYSNEITTDISEGDYKVTLQAYDGYYDRVAVDDQPNESYQLLFLNGDDVIATSSPHTDLADGVPYISVEEEVDASLYISGADGVKAAHAYLESTGSANSVRPVCAGLKEINTEEPFVRSAEITSPEVNEVVSGTLYLSAVLNDKDGDDVANWAIKKGTCEPGPETNVISNINGVGEPFSWDGYNFSATTSVALWENGDYCFVFNPTESLGDTEVRETRMFKVDNTYPRSAEIISPEINEIVSGTLYLSAVLDDKDGDDTAYWAVRKGTCSGINMVGNIPGFFDESSWDGYNFSATTSVALWENGDYCFVFNPNESLGDIEIRKTRMFKVDNTYPRSAEIVSPLEGEVVTGNVNFKAVLDDKDKDDNVQWAVRKGTCAVGTNTVIGNVDGVFHPYDWLDGTNFSATSSVSLWDSGEYCFVFNPTESQGDVSIRETRKFIVDNDPPIVNLVFPEHGDTLSGIVDIYGTVFEDVALKNYNLSIYPGDADFTDYDQRIFGKTKNTSQPGFTNQKVHSWNTSLNPDGEYYIRFTATDSVGNKDVSCDVFTGGLCSRHVIQVTVDNDTDEPLSLSAGIESNFGEVSCLAVDGSVSVDFYGSALGGTSPYTYSWDFGDSSGTSNEQNPSYEYNAAGSYEVILTATDDLGVVATSSEMIEIENCESNVEYAWATSDWSVCSVSCGGGTQTRDVYCTANGDRVDDNYCVDAIGEAPTTSQTCNSQSCGSGTFSSSGSSGGGISPFSLTNTQITMQCVDGKVNMDITWLTNYQSSSRVVYDTASHAGVLGLAPNYGYASSTTLDSNTVTGHSVSINGLESNTFYYFRPISIYNSNEVVGEEKPLTKTLSCEGDINEIIVLGEEGAPDLTLSHKSLEEFVNPGAKNVQFELIVTNNGDLTSYNTVLTKELPDGFNYAGIGGAHWTWHLGDILPGESKVVKVGVNVSGDAKAGNYKSEASVTSDNNEEVVATADLEVRLIAVLAETGFSAIEFGAMLSLLFVALGLKKVLKSKLASI